MMMGAKQTSTDPHSKLIIDWLHTARVYNTKYQMIYIYIYVTEARQTMGGSLQASFGML